MHYRNGREAKNGDPIVQLNDKGEVQDAGTLIDAVPGNDYCNGTIANAKRQTFVMACLCDCLHADDVAALIVAAGHEKRPAGK